MLLALLVCWYLIATLPHLKDFPVLDVGQMGIVAPASKLATQGIYGHDLFTGYYRSELRNYAYMPAYPVLVAFSLKLFGPGVWQARIVSVLAGLLLVIITVELGRRMFSLDVGLLSGVVLCMAPLAVGPTSSGVPLLDFARLIRFDVLVPVFVLASSLVFLRGMATPEGSPGSRRRRSGTFAVCGLLAGLATLTHVYGTFLLPVLAAVALWQWGRSAARRPEPYAALAGWLVALLPWVAYVVQDLPAYLGQMAERHAGRFDIGTPQFYWNNLLREYARYGPWHGGFPEGMLQPRVGFWLILTGVVGGTVVLWKRARFEARVADRFLVLALPLIALQLALLINQKRNVYLAAELPFIALEVAVFTVAVLRWARERGQHVVRFTFAALLLAGAFEGVWGVAAHLRAMSGTTPYAEVTGAIANVLRPGSRVLLSETYWLGLAEHEARSVDLVYLESRTSPLDEVMERLDPDYVIFERFYLVPASDPRGRGTPESERWWRRFGDYVQQRCPRVLTVAGGSYGLVDVHDCRL